MLAYSLLVVPIVEPEEGSRRQSMFSLTLPDDHWWEGFFPEDSWQRQRPQIFYSKQGVLLASSLERIDEKTLRLEPLTLIMPQSDAGRRAMERQQRDNVTREDMWVISAEQGATIHFDEALQLHSGSLPTIARGELKGAIEVSRQIASDIGKRPWRLRTYDLTINRTQVSTRREVLIEWDGSRVRGHDLLIRLRGDLLGKEGSSSAAWGPLDELELYHVDEVNVALPPGGIWADLDPQHLAGVDQSDQRLAFPLKTLPARLTASCNGRFNFDFSSSTATLQNKVQVQHQLGDLTPDTFTCERIAVYLDSPKKPNAIGPEGDQGIAPGSVPGNAGGRNRSSGMGALQVRGLEAIGADSVKDFVGEKWVELNIPTLGIDSQSKTLKVDMSNRRVEFGGKLPHPGSVQSSVVLQYQGNTFRSPRIVYQAAPETKPGPQAKSNSAGVDHLGWMIADGPGEIQSTGSSHAVSHGSKLRGTFNVRWDESLKMAPAPEQDGSQWLELVGKTFVQSSEHGFLTSDRIELWLAPQNEPGADQPSYLPRRVFSNAPTTLASPSLKAKVTGLDLQLRTQSALPPQSESAETDELVLSDSQGNPMHQWVTPPADRSQSGPGTLAGGSLADGALAEGRGDASRPPAKQPVPIEVSGRQLQATLMRSGDVSWVEQLQIEGPVQLSGSTMRSTSKSVGSREPVSWKVSGDLLLLATDLQGNADLQVEGAPAKIRVGDGLLEGESIRFNQTHNLVIMDHPGEFTIPKSMLENPNDANSITKSENISWFDPPHCKWSGRMIFDGQTIRVEKDVEFSAGFASASPSGTPSETEYWRTAGIADSLAIRLSKQIGFRSDFGLAANGGQATSSGDTGADAELDSMTLAGNVNILAWQFDHLGEKKSRNEILVPSLTFHMQKNEVVGAGPGWIQSRFVADRSIATLANTGEATRREELQGAYLKFRDSVLGEMLQRQVTFDGKIELLTGPIPSWQESVEPNASERLLPDQILLNSDQLKVYDTRPTSRSGYPIGSGSYRQNSPSSSWEFKAMGNVAFNGITDSGEYNGTGYELSYAKSKDLLILRGDQRKSAYLRRVPADDSTGTTEAHVESVGINPKTMEVIDFKMGPGGIAVQLDAMQSTQGGLLPGSTDPNSTGNRSTGPRDFRGFRSSNDSQNSSSNSSSQGFFSEQVQDSIPDPRGELFRRSRQ